MIWLSYRLQLLTPAQCRAWLAQTEWQHAQTLSAKRARQFCNGRALIRKLLCQHQPLHNDAITIELPADKAPALTVEGQCWQLSISHSANAVAVAVSHSNKLGLDIEQLKPRNYTALSQQYIALAGAEDLTGFYQRWTTAEACSKYSGEPLLQVLSKTLPDKMPCHYLPLKGYMLCLTHQHANAEITISEDKL
ncbi:MAG TPA: hypothetical protein VFY01_06355 [Rheinheimera sp.]|nr:hypothetical protein [Rheinheimera sp.]